MRYLQYILLAAIISSCSVTKQINKQAVNILLHDSVIKTGHVGISIYEPATGKYWYNYDADKYFVPASNVKLFTLYAGMKYLGDSLVGMRYTYSDSVAKKYRFLIIFPTGDPTFLHEDFVDQPVFDFFKRDSSIAFCLCDTAWKENSLGFGWSWDDYNEKYMAERNSFPLFGNKVSIKLKSEEEIKRLYALEKETGEYYNTNYFSIKPSYFDSTINRDISYQFPSYAITFEDSNRITILPKFEIRRDRASNRFILNSSESVFTDKSIPLHFDSPVSIPTWFLSSHFKKNSFYAFGNYQDSSGKYLTVMSPDSRPRIIKLGPVKIIHSQLTDSLLKPMMHNSDNFFAEQTLLMASNEKLGYMNDEAIIDTLLSNDLKDIPQKPKWVDGSGLSRYNLFTPQDFIYILNKMKNEFGLERLKNILPTGNAGTLNNYYVTDSSFIYAKTGSLSNHIALSGFLITRKNKLLIFSVLNNSFIGRATSVRRAVEKFLKQVRENN